MFCMLLNVMLEKDEIKKFKEMLFTPYDQFEEYLKDHLDQEMTDKMLEVIKDHKEFVNSFLDNVEMINISMEKKIDGMMEEEKKNSKSKWGMLD